MTQGKVVLLVADAEKDSIIGVTQTGELRKVFNALPPLPGIRDLAQADEGRLFVACAASNEIVCLSPDGRYLKTFSAPCIEEPGSLDLDVAGNLYVTSRQGKALVKLDRDGKIIAQREISQPRAVFLSR